MTYTIENQIVDYSTMMAGYGYTSKLSSTKWIIAHETANNTATIDNEVRYMKTNASNAFVTHFVGGGGRIIQVAPVGKVCWGAGATANSCSYAQIELCRAKDQATFQKDYAAYVWLLRKLADECGIPKTLDTEAKGIKSHAWVSAHYPKETNHTDPYGYLSTMGISKAQFAADIANGIGASAAAAPTNRVAVSYNATILNGGYSIDSKPWGEAGMETWGNTTDLRFRAFYFYEENGSGEYANGQGLGWVDKRALTKERKETNYQATVIGDWYSVDSLPWGEAGFTQLGTTANHVGSVVTVRMETLGGEYAYIVNSEKELGWVDKRALVEGVVSATPAEPEPVAAPEPVVVASILYLPNGKEWVIYPENGPYTAGDIISVEGPKADGGLSLKILGDKGGNIVVVELPNFGVVGLYFDEDKGARIEKQYAS